MDDTEARAMLGLYQGYKTGKASSCTQFAQGTHKLMISSVCEVLFGTKLSTTQFERMVNDLVEEYKKKAALYSR